MPALRAQAKGSRRMAQLFDIKKIAVGPRTLAAEVEVAPSAPLLTSDDPEGTQLMVELMPEIAGHVCLGDAGPHFGEVVADTELAHLLEHVTVELLARTDAAGDISTGRTTQVGERTFEIELSCPDDVLVAGALSSAVWIMQWAYSGGGEPKPDVDAIASGLVDLVASVSEQPVEDEGALADADSAAPEAEEGEKLAEAGEPAAAAAQSEPVPVEAPVQPEQLQLQPEEYAPQQDELLAEETMPAEGAFGPAEALAPDAAPASPQDGWNIYSGPEVRSIR